MRMPDNEEAIWSREGCYTWKELYAQSNRYSQYLLSLGFKSRELVAFYLTNSPEFIMAVLGVWALGAAPAMINYHLAGEALVHCIKISGAKLLLVDWDDECRARIEEVRGQLEGDLGIRIIILDAATKAHINSLEPIRPPDEMRSRMPPDYPMALIYTSGSTGYPKAISFSVGRTLVMTSKTKANAIGVRRGPDGDRYYNCKFLCHRPPRVKLLTRIQACQCITVLEEPSRLAAYSQGQLCASERSLAPANSGTMSETVDLRRWCMSERLLDTCSLCHPALGTRTIRFDLLLATA